MSARRLTPRQRFREFVHKHGIDLPTAVLIEDAISQHRRIDWKLLDSLMWLVRERKSMIRADRPAEQLIRLLLSDQLHEWSDIDAALSKASDLIGAHGVETLADAYDDVVFLYANVGDSYSSTIAYADGKFLVTSLGGWVEWAESSRRPRLRFE